MLHSVPFGAPTRTPVQGPAANAFLNVTLVYNYEPGRPYRIDASPRFLTTIALRPGEHLISKASGDTVRWVLAETAQGSGDATQVIVFVKPIRGGQRTNIVLTTDRRIYHFEAVSHEEPTYTSVISWNYLVDQAREAQDAAVRLATAQAAQQAAEQDRVDSHVDPLTRAVALATAITVGGFIAQNAFTRSSGNLVLNDAAGGVAASASQIGQRFVDRDLNRQPTLRTRPGWPLHVSSTTSQATSTAI